MWQPLEVADVKQDSKMIDILRASYGDKTYNEKGLAALAKVELYCPVTRD